MSILSDFVNPWESGGALGRKALSTDVLKDNVLNQNQFPSFGSNEKKGFRHGKELVEQVYNKALEALAPLEAELKRLQKQIGEKATELRTLSESATDQLRKGAIREELQEVSVKIKNQYQKIADSEFNKARLEINTMRKADAIFDVLPTHSYLGEAKFDGYSDEGLPIIGLYYPSKNILDKLPLVAHELKHGYQFINGELAFDISSGKAVMLYDIVDEIEAFQREAAFVGGQMEKKGNFFYADVRPNPFDITSLLKTYEEIYDRIGDKQLSLSTKFKEISQKGQDAIIFGNDKIDASSREYDKYFRNSDYTVKECLEKYDTIIFYGI